MDIAWLEDFLAVVEHGTFSRAAEARGITQPALSRRVRALEDWVGTALFFRTTHRVELSPAGAGFREPAEEVLRQLQVGRSIARERASSAVEQLRFASTNALALTFFPRWLRSAEALLPYVANIQLVANHMVACERMMLQGEAQFLLCHHHPAADTLLSAPQFQSRPVGLDVLVPASAPAAPGSRLPAFALPGSADAPLPYLAYSPESGMGRIFAAVRRTSPRNVFLKPAFESHLAKLLVAMTAESRGLAFLPASLIVDELATGALVRAGDESWDVPIAIHIFRPRARMQAAAETFWSAIVKPAKA